MTDRQQRFAAEWLVDCNATDAAIRAGYTDNRASAATIGSRLLQNVEVRDLIGDHLASITAGAVADATEVGRFLTAAMRDSDAPWAARMMAAAQLARRQAYERHDPPPPIIIDNFAASGEPLSPDAVAFCANGRPVKVGDVEHLFDLAARLGLDWPGVDN